VKASGYIAAAAGWALLLAAAWLLIAAYLLFEP
jgi:hypothetical protein